MEQTAVSLLSTSTVTWILGTRGCLFTVWNTHTSPWKRLLAESWLAVGCTMWRFSACWVNLRRPVQTECWGSWEMWRRWMDRLSESQKNWNLKTEHLVYKTGSWLFQFCSYILCFVFYYLSHSYCQCGRFLCSNVLMNCQMGHRKLTPLCTIQLYSIIFYVWTDYETINSWTQTCKKLPTPPTNQQDT